MACLALPSLDAPRLVSTRTDLPSYEIAASRRAPPADALRRLDATCQGPPSMHRRAKPAAQHASGPETTGPRQSGMRPASDRLAQTHTACHDMRRLARKHEDAPGGDMTFLSTTILGDRRPAVTAHARHSAALRTGNCEALPIRPHVDQHGHAKECLAENEKRAARRAKQRTTATAMTSPHDNAAPRLALHERDNPIRTRACLPRPDMTSKVPTAPSPGLRRRPALCLAIPRLPYPAERRED